MDLLNNPMNFSAGSPLAKRIKERTIAEAIALVIEWRRLQTGVSSHGKVIKYSTDTAAIMLGVRKKSLDDYLL